MLWLVSFKGSHFLYYIPLLLSNVGKIYIMSLQKQGEQSNVTAELIIFQNHT